MKSTDNYLEKYFPIKMQNFISDCFSYCLGKKELGKLHDYEGKRYKALHEVIMRDDGRVNLNKKGFHIPDFAKEGGEKKKKRGLTSTTTGIVG
jgi:hypothetical protein